MDHTSNLLSPPELTPLEQEVLEEYERLANNMKQVGYLASLLHPQVAFSPLSLSSSMRRNQFAFLVNFKKQAI